MAPGQGEPPVPDVARTGPEIRQQTRKLMALEDFLQEYVEEVREHLQELENSLLNLERDGADGDEINQIFRAAHSIKGASAYMGFERLANLTHELESLISEIRKSSRPITTEGISVMLECVDFISNAVNLLEANEGEPLLPELLLQGIHSALSAGDGEAGVKNEGVKATPEDGERLGEAARLEPERRKPDAGDSGQSGAGEAFPAEAEEAVVLEEDGELFRIYAAALRERFEDLAGLLNSGVSARTPEAVLDTAREILRQMVLSSQYMDYGPAVNVLNELDDSLQKASREEDSGDGQGLLDQLYACGLRLQRVLPGLDLPLPVQPAERESPPGYVEREEDEELFQIYLDSFRETFAEFDGFMPGDPGAALSEVEFIGIREVIQRLISSSQYMDYDLIANTLQELDRDLQEAHRIGIATGSRLSERLDAVRGQLKAHLPALGDLHPAIEPLDGGPKVDIFGGEMPESLDFFEEIAAQAESLIRDLAPEPFLAGMAGEPAGAKEESAGWQPIPEDSAMPREGDGEDWTDGAKPEEESEAASAPLEKVSSGHPVQKRKKPSGHERIYAVAEDITSSPTLRVDAQKVDQLLNQVGELVVTRSEFIQTSQLLREFLRELSSAGRLSKAELRKLRSLNFRLNESTQSLGRVANDLQDSVMRVRMLPISFLFQRFHRVVRDHSIKLGKRIDLIVDGGETEIDKRVLEQMYDPIVQFLRNAITHGIELPDQRTQASKPETGTIRLAASHQGDYVTLEIEDDGRGIDLKKLRRVLEARKELSAREIDRLSEQELLYAIFLPGVSTQDEPDGNAGRGVGLDVAKENVERMNGSIEVETFPSVGTRFTIRIPLTVAIIRALLVGGLSQTFTIPLTSVSEILRYVEEDVHTIEGFEVIALRGKTIPLIHLSQLLNIAHPSISDGKHKSIVIVTTSFREVGLVVDSLLGEREVVIKPLDTDAHDYEGFSGATILGDGAVSLVLDVSSLLRQLKDTFGERRRSRESVYQ